MLPAAPRSVRGSPTLHSNPTLLLVVAAVALLRCLLRWLLQKRVQKVVL